LLGGQGGGLSGPDMQKAMNNPDMKQMFNNPEMIKNAINMMKDNPAMIEMIKTQIPGASEDTIRRGLRILSSLAEYYMISKRFFSHKLVQASLLALFIYVVYRWIG